MLSSSVRIPATFWYPQIDLSVLHRRIYNEENYQPIEQELREALRAVATEEETGQVSRVTILNMILLGRKVRSASWRYGDEARKQLLIEVNRIAKKYGVSKLWRASYQWTFLNRLNEDVAKGDLTVRSNCARCGREIWAEISLRRGVGPVCWGHRDE